MTNWTEAISLHMPLLIPSRDCYCYCSQNTLLIYVQGVKDTKDGMHNSEETFDDDDIEIQEGEVTCTFLDGIISITFSDRIQSLTERSFDETLVVKLLGRRIGYTTL
ncbi:hypothetical protein V6N11_043277 [Hibiscus sabdariffa]|uniref:Uncharacterized protein n=1 Tax=Hibiscus sabdariffa TaxID=183260 RepID=A0ABR2QZJ9_9ROSI